MKIEYDYQADALYIYFCESGKKVTETVTVKPGVHVDFDEDGRIMGLEVLSASKVIDKKVIELALPEVISA
ncbi:MAG: DUF2283 domain-containing protein [Deferribacteres bacterium]|nr:DUF2283 domain-containing protein [Deferribacteres bacterium]